MIQANSITPLDVQDLTLPRNNPASFGMYVYGHAPAAHHWEWLKALHDPHTARLLIVAPRGSAKTRWTIEIDLTWRLCVNPTLAAFIGSVSDAQAISRLKTIMTLIETNAKVREVFPHIEPDYKRGWSTAGLHVKDTRYTYADWIDHVARNGQLKMPNLLAAGVGSSATIGSRFNTIALDDLHDEKNSATELQREKVNGWLMQTVIPTLLPGGNVFLVNTRWHRDDQVARLKANPEWRTIETSAIDANGRSYWAKEFPLSRLHRIEREIGRAYFRSQYLNDPSGLAGDIFEAAWFQPLPEPLPTFRAVGVFVDLAISLKDDADYTVIATCAIDADNRLYILDIQRGHWTFNETQRRMVSAAERAQSLYGKLSMIGIEKVAYQAAAVQELKRTTDYPVRGIAVDSDKVTRATAWAARAQDGDVFIDKIAHWAAAFIDEAVDFPRGKKDQIDAISLAWQALARKRQITAVVA